MERYLPLHSYTVVASLEGLSAGGNETKDVEFAEALTVFGDESNENVAAVHLPSRKEMA